MAWTTPLTAVAGEFTAAQWNTYVRDNLLETAPGIATGTGPFWFVSDGANSITTRQFKTAAVTAEQTTSSSSYTNLATSGPSVTIKTGTVVIVMMIAMMGNDSASSATQCSYSISGATTRSASDNWFMTSDGLAAAGPNDNLRTNAVAHATTVNAGWNTFTMKYKCTSGTARFSQRQLIIWSF